MSSAPGAESPAALAERAMELMRRGDYAAAEPLFSRLLRLAPGNPGLLNGAARCLVALGRAAEALGLMARALEVAPLDAVLHVNYAGCLASLGRHGDALAPLARAIELKPADAASRYNLARSLAALGRRAEALAAYDAALERDPRLFQALSARAALRAEDGDIHGAASDLDMATIQRPHDLRLAVRRAELRLAAGDWLGGLAAWEARLDLPDPTRRAARAAPWRGGPLDGARILLHSERNDPQTAAADILQMLRFVPALAARAAAVMLEAPAALLPSLGGIPGLGSAIAWGEGPVDADVAVPMASLPLALDAEPSTLPKPLDPFPPPVVAPRAADGKLLVGVATGGAVPALDLLAPIAALQGVRLVALGAVHGERPDWLADIGLRDDTAPDRLALALDALDLVVGGDALAAHVAGVRGRPLCVLLPTQADWRWLHGRNDTPWYPSARLFRQDRAGDWAAPLAALARAVAERAARR